MFGPPGAIEWQDAHMANLASPFARSAVLKGAGRDACTFLNSSGVSAGAACSDGLDWADWPWLSVEDLPQPARPAARLRAMEVTARRRMRTGSLARDGG